jgi:hypothetical protein
MFDSTMAPTASHRSPGPASDSKAVASTQPAVLKASRRFLLARRSASAPIDGMVSMTTALDSANALVHAKVAHDALPATTPTK